MILAVAQTRPKRQNIQANLIDHARLVESAADHGVDLIVFPEMSLSGYERDIAHNLSFSPQDSRLEPLMRLADEKNMVIIVGAPIKIDKSLHIGSFLIFPDGSTSIYTKQYLHNGEEEYFEPGFEHNPRIRLSDEIFALAICADIENSSHAAQASDAGCTIYLASIFYTPGGIDQAHNLLGGYAQKYSMAVFMANFGGPSWGLDSGGRSACWQQSGEKIVELEGLGEGLIVVEKWHNQWRGQAVRVK